MTAQLAEPTITPEQVWTAASDAYSPAAALDVATVTVAVPGPVPGRNLGVCVTGSPSILCGKCGTRSWSASDVLEGYCGLCHAWTGGLVT